MIARFTGGAGIREISHPAKDRWRRSSRLYPQRLQLDQQVSRIAEAFDIEGQAIVDGEVVVIYESRTNFSELQADLGRGDQDRLIYFAFDLLWLDGKDLRKEPLIERKRLLKELIEEQSSRSPSCSANTMKGTGRRCSSPPAS
ncbi:hypothetical protein ACNJX9_16945 [Bradyrhizobium sp. DASA03076]|uniref:ATP-dependent DNA ligase n=1 Tax=Bradyrhizobium sp. BLXBL-03 TaxID=3395916 RepID=UPI003F6FB81A